MLAQPQLGLDKTHACPPLDNLLAGGLRLVDDCGEVRLGFPQLTPLDQRGGQLDPHLSLSGIIPRDQIPCALE